MKGRIVGLVVLGAALVEWSPAPRAQLSPGPLHNAHAALEGVSNCTRCHDLGKRLSAEKCLACHTALRERVAAGRGLHALKGHAECGLCHVEHQGRGGMLVFWKGGRASFDHTSVGFPLEGAHAPLACERCHARERIREPHLLDAGGVAPDRTFLGLDRACAACHRDAHGGELSGDCLRCHDQKAWRPAPGFDHARTRYPLTGRHVDLACEKCHRQDAANAAADAEGGTNQVGVLRRFGGLSHGDCSACHEDPHEGRFHESCASCHHTGGWRAAALAGFDHARTRYPLRGRHASLDCRACHREGARRGGLRFAACRDCHADPHGGQFAGRADGGVCEACHTVDGYSPATFTVTQHQQTDYPLAGAHLAAPCVACHVRPRAGVPASEIPFVFQSTRCADCHADPHRGETARVARSSGCEGCHRVDGWNAVTFAHTDTEFPLEGRHRQVACAKCHPPLDPPGAGALRLRGVTRECAGCHRDIHRGQFAVAGDAGDTVTACTRCHTATDWLAEKFDHDRDAAFVIDGAHRHVACERCHPRESAGGESFIRYKPLDKACRACHARPLEAAGGNEASARPGGRTP